MLYPELFKQLESVRWDMDRDIPWASFDSTQLSDEQAVTVKATATSTTNRFIIRTGPAAVRRLAPKWVW